MLNNKDELMANLNEEAYKIWAYERRVKAHKEDIAAYTEMKQKRIKSLENRAAFKRNNLMGNMKSLGVLKLTGKIPVTLSPLRDESVRILDEKEFIERNICYPELCSVETRYKFHKKEILKAVKAGEPIEEVVIETKDRLRIG